MSWPLMLISSCPADRRPYNFPLDGRFGKEAKDL